MDLQHENDLMPINISPLREDRIDYQFQSCQTLTYNVYLYKSFKIQIYIYIYLKLLLKTISHQSIH